MARIELRVETFDEVWPECDELASKHFTEVDGGVEPRRVYKLDYRAMRQLSQLGFLKIFTARDNGQLVGYCTWNVMPDIESQGLLIARQGAWFMDDSFGLGSVGLRLFRFAMSHLKNLGVQMIFPHHRLQGRGKDLGKFFTRIGCKPIMHEYCLWIGD